MTRRVVFNDTGTFDDGSGTVGTFPGAVASVFGRTGTIVAVTGDYYGAVASALTGATQASRYSGATASGAPVSGTFVKGDWVVAQDGHIFVCTSGGTPGTWTDVSTGGAGVTYGTPAIVLGTAAAAGSTDEAIRRDSTIVAFDATAPTTQAFGDSAAAGSAAVAARRDHKHAMPANPSDASITVTDVTTNNAATGQHGFLKKLDNSAAHFMDGQGNWSTPAGTAPGVAADTIWDAKGDIVAASAADTAARLAVGSDGKVLTADAASTLGVKWATPAAAAGAVAAALAVGSNGGDITTTSGSFTDFGLTVTVAAATGDLLFVAFAVDWSINAAPPVNAFFEVVTTTGSHVVDFKSPQSFANGGRSTLTLASLYTVVSGDISSGNVALKARFATGSATLTASNSGNNIPRLSAMNLLH